MSGDDMILIVKHNGVFEGYWVMGDFDYKIKELRKLTFNFKVKTIEEAILKAQEYDTEYGYRFVNLKVGTK